LTGAEEADSLVGGAGNDTLTGGGGSDLLDGQVGEDRLLARDSHGDLVRGGAGSDSAQTDAITIDAIDGVETIDATPPPPPPTPKRSSRSSGISRSSAVTGTSSPASHCRARGRDRRLPDDGDAHHGQDDPARSGTCNARSRLE
jgi:hypothetical protein